MTPGCWFFCGGGYGALLTAAAWWWIRRRRRKEIDALFLTESQFRAGLYQGKTGHGAQKGRSDGAIARPRAPRRARAYPGAATGGRPDVRAGPRACP